MTTQVTDYLKYANLQMAAEALYGFPPGSSLAPGQHYFGEIKVNFLTDGNNHASKFTPTLAAEFVQQWDVVQHLSNTETGFSGTLFRGKAGGLYAGELVLSFRSTEFVDDQVRDSGVTNKGIKEFGWAFGQIADMEDWYASLKASGAIAEGARFAVTGYSLGGHMVLGGKRCTA